AALIHVLQDARRIPLAHNRRWPGLPLLRLLKPGRREEMMVDIDPPRRRIERVAGFSPSEPRQNHAGAERRHRSEQRPPGRRCAPGFMALQISHRRPSCFELFNVIPAKAGTHSSTTRAAGRWVPAFAGMTIK